MSLNKMFNAGIVLIVLNKLQVGAFSLCPGQQLISDLPLLLSVWWKNSHNQKKRKIQEVEVTAVDAAIGAVFSEIAFYPTPLSTFGELL